MSGSGAVSWRSRVARLPPSSLVFLFLAITIPLWTNVFLSPPDSGSYVAWARTLVRGQDLDFRDEYPALRFKERFIYISDEMRFSNDWPAGSGILWAPAYGVTDLVSRLIHGKPQPMGESLHDRGVSPLHLLGMTFFILALAIYVLVRALNVLTDEWGRAPAFVAFFALLLGTPLGFYFYAYALMSHVSSMAVVGLFFLSWLKTRPDMTNRPRNNIEWLWLGILIGAMSLIRPQNLLFALVLLLEVVPNRERLKSESSSWFIGWGIAGIASAVVFSPQMIIWQTLYGNPLALPKIEEMHWLAPRFGELLFSDYHGWVSWSPVLILVPLGLWKIWQRDRLLALGIFAIVAAQVYLNAVNEIWWAGGSFGNRRLINCSIPLFFCFAAALSGPSKLLTRPIAIVASGWTLLLMARERSGDLSLDHYTEWSSEFFIETLTYARPDLFFSGMWGDFGNAGLLARLLFILLFVFGAVMFAVLALKGRGEASVSVEPSSSAPVVMTIKRHPLAAVFGFYFLVIAPVWVTIAATNTGRIDDLTPFERVPRRNVTLFSGYYEGGFYYMTRNEPMRAREYYLKAAELIPTSPLPYRYLGLIHLEDLDDPEGALFYTHQALGRDPTYFQALVIESNAIKRVLRTDPSRGDLMLRLIRRFRDANMPEHAAKLEQNMAKWQEIGKSQQPSPND
jgi:hypothetical protein